MTSRKPDRSRIARLDELLIADDGERWRAAGFDVADDGSTSIGDIGVRLSPDASPQPGIVSWTISGLADSMASATDIDGLPTTVAARSGEVGHADPARRANGTVGLDHLVIATPDLERTIAAFEALGIGCRRIREASLGASSIRQAFFRLGPTIVEVVGGPVPDGSDAHASEDGSTDDPTSAGPASFWGLSVDVDDLDATAAHLGDGLGSIRPAVQEGRRIATFRHRALGIGVRIAAMDHHRDRAGA